MSLRVTTPLNGGGGGVDVDNKTLVGCYHLADTTQPAKTKILLAAEDESCF